MIKVTFRLVLSTKDGKMKRLLFRNMELPFVPMPGLRIDFDTKVFPFVPIPGLRIDFDTKEVCCGISVDMNHPYEFWNECDNCLAVNLEKGDLFESPEEFESAIKHFTKDHCFQEGN